MPSKRSAARLIVQNSLGGVQLGVPAVLRDEVWRRMATFTSLSGVLTEQTEHYFRAEIHENHTASDLHRLRDEGVTEVRWGTLGELSTTTETDGTNRQHLISARSGR